MIQSTEIPIPQVAPKKNNLPMILGGVLVFLLVIAGSVYAGMKIQEKKSLGSLTPGLIINDNPPTSQAGLVTCGPCPQFMPHSPDACQDGIIIPGKKDECGCQMPPTCDQTADWKTYTNAKYGFEFKYPPEYQIESCKSCFDLTTSDFVTLFPPSMSSAKGYGSFRISHLKDKSINQSVVDYLNELSTIVNQPVVPGSIQQTVINGYSGLIVVNRDKFNDTDDKNVYITNGIEGIHLNFFGFYSSENRGIHLDGFKNLSIFDQILSTFKFLE